MAPFHGTMPLEVRGAVELAAGATATVQLEVVQRLVRVVVMRWSMRRLRDSRVLRCFDVDLAMVADVVTAHPVGRDGFSCFSAVAVAALVVATTTSTP
jgi:hypothetical protein